ncbi:MAG TPA: SDR family NAD(P)-dependent oxidoreductase [Opitutaceae bacterium]|nr:SDR family NAD(P)-dependent oxidoreductase [Opitutaceae bacterium]
MAAAKVSDLHRTAFVSGASAGLGAAFADMLLADGVRVWGTARDAGRLPARAGFSPVVLDLSDAAGAEKNFLHAAAAAGGAFDLVIHNAGYGVFGPFVAADFGLWQAQIEAMLGATLRLAQTALRPMLARNRGCLVNVSSLAAEFPLPFMSGYNTVKAGLSAFSESLILETRGTGVSVIDFRPGDYHTTFNQAMHRLPSAPDETAARVWRRLEANLRAAPPPARAAADLRRALLHGRRGTVRSGTFFQARLAPLLARFAPLALRRAALQAYYGIR